MRALIVPAIQGVLIAVLLLVMFPEMGFGRRIGGILLLVVILKLTEINIWLTWISGRR